MPSRSDSALLSLIEETAVLCEAAESDFERLSEEVRKTVRESGKLTEQALLEHDRARKRVIDAHVRLSDHLHRRDPKVVTACYCKGRLWVCRRHAAVALDECQCGAPSVPCSCNPNRSAPPGYEQIGPAPQGWSRPRSIRSRPAKNDDGRWYSVRGAIRPRDGEQVLVRQLLDIEPLRVVYRSALIARWLSPDAIYQFEYFAEWRRL